MSRYEWEHGDLDIAVGWDNPLKTLFVIVSRESEEHEDPEILAWVGGKPGETRDVSVIAKALREYGGLPLATSNQLCLDMASAPPRTPLQEQLAGLFGWPSDR
jgi:hypothetical protein